MQRARPSFYVQEDEAYQGWLQRKLKLWEAGAILEYLSQATGEGMPELLFNPEGEYHLCDDRKMDLLLYDLRPIVLLHEWAHMMQWRHEGYSGHEASFATTVALLVEILRSGT